MEKEIAIGLSLKEKELTALALICGKYGLTPKEALESFAESLSRSGGHERQNELKEECAKRYLQAAADPAKAEGFTSWLIGAGDPLAIIDALEVIDTASAEINYFEAHPDELRDGEADQLLTDLEEAEAEINHTYKAYLQAATDPEELAAAMEGVRRLSRTINDITGGTEE